MIFIAKDDEVSKKRTREHFELAGLAGGKKNWQMIFVKERGAIVPNKPEDVDKMEKFLYKGSGNPPGMDIGMHIRNKYHWYVPSRIEYTRIVIDFFELVIWMPFFKL